MCHIPHGRRTSTKSESKENFIWKTDSQNGFKEKTRVRTWKADSVCVRVNGKSGGGNRLQIRPTIWWQFFDDIGPAGSGKFSVFTRFFRSQKKRPIHRDFSIDEKPMLCFSSLRGMTPTSTSIPWQLGDNHIRHGPECIAGPLIRTRRRAGATSWVWRFGAWAWTATARQAPIEDTPWLRTVSRKSTSSNHSHAAGTGTGTLMGEILSLLDYLRKRRWRHRLRQFGKNQLYTTFLLSNFLMVICLKFCWW